MATEPREANVGIILHGDGPITLPMATVRRLVDENAALREKLEAAERDRTRLHDALGKAQYALTEARAAQAAAWEALRERAAGIAGLTSGLAADRIRALTPPADLSAALQRVRDEAWNEAVEAAATLADQYRKRWPIAFAPDAQHDVKQQYLHMAKGADIVEGQIRALRRAPTEGEG